MKIISRTWTSKDPTGKRIKRIAYGYTQVNGKQERRWSSDWQSEADVLKALHERQQQVQSGRIERPAMVTFGEVVNHYLKFKAGKQSLANDRHISEKQLLPAFGSKLSIRKLTTHMIAAYEERRMTEVSAWTVRNELTVLRHLLRLSQRRRGYLDQVPHVDMPKSPNGRTRYLSEEEISKLLTARAASKNRHLSATVTLAIHTGMRKGEILGLEWERVDLAKDLGFNARITLYDTKNREPRGVPLNKAAIAALASIEPDPAQRTGRVFKRRKGRTGAKSEPPLKMPCSELGCRTFAFTTSGTQQPLTLLCEAGR